MTAVNAPHGVRIFSATTHLGLAAGHRRGLRDRSPEVLHQQDKVKRVAGSGLESRIQAPGEPSRVRSLSMNQECPCPDAIGDRRHLQEGIAHEFGSEPAMLVSIVDAKAGQDDDRDGVPAHTASEPRRCLDWRDGARR